MREREVDEEALMAAYAQGDLAAFERLFRSLAPRVHAFFVRRFGNEAIADDMLQVTFMKLHRARADYRAGSAVRPWVFTIAARVGLDEIRRRGRRPEETDDERVDRAYSAEAVQRAVDERDPVEQADLQMRVREALEALPESQRSVVHLHRYEGLTFKEIGAVLGLSEGAVKLRAFRAYEALRDNLAAFVTDQGLVSASTDSVSAAKA
ncbi:MAG: RNA polymerase sigma factor [Deltaproteobacteria bacterium]|nr:RNA polymerase sigma factor [Deltaproteobacteria bacterium]